MKPEAKTKIKLFTHSDLDGVACYIVLAEQLGKENVSVEYCEYHNINEKVKAFIESGSTEYDHILITDISVNEEVAKLIHRYDGSNIGDFYLYDHHKTAEWLNKYPWAMVYSEYEEPSKQKGEVVVRKSSGASIVAYNYLQHILHEKISPELAYFVEKVRRYDSWEWNDIYNDMEAKQLNDLLSIYGRQDFIQDIHDKIWMKWDLICDEDKKFLDLRQKEIDGYIRMKEKSMKVASYGGYNIGFIFNERFSSEMGNTICQKHPDLDLVAMINMDTNSVSLRTIHDHVDVSEFARQFGGGGHPKASGMPLREDTRRVFMEFNFPGILI